jgi:hypothetical protein
VKWAALFLALMLFLSNPWAALLFAAGFALGSHR